MSKQKRAAGKKTPPEAAKVQEDRARKRLAQVRKKRDPTKSREWRKNHLLILEVYLLLLKSNKVKPTYDQLSESTGLSVSTICKHLQFDNFEQDLSEMRILTPQVLMSVFTSSMSGNMVAAKMFMQLVHGWVPPDSGQGDSLSDITKVVVLPDNGRSPESGGGWSAENWDKLEEMAKRISK